MSDDSNETPKTAREKLHDSILSDLKSRVKWEAKQVDFFRLRNQGIGRIKKPWASAADLHFPLIDTNIEKLKPLFFQQIVGMDVVASFVPMRAQAATMTAQAEQLFDYKIREKTNLQDESLSWIDRALLTGRGIMKVTWRNKKKRVDFTEVDPIYIIVPSHTKELQDADRVVHVMPMSVAAYKRCGEYDVSRKTLDKIKGDGLDSNDGGQADARAARQSREGITHDKNDDKVIVWEVYERQADGGWVVSWYSPVEPEISLRDPIKLPYEHGMVPFVDFAYEVTYKDWYAPRGIAEILAPFEASLCHTWNQKHDSMQLFNKPTYTAEREVPNVLNLRVSPGQVLPYGIKPTVNPQPPISFDTEMSFVRGIAEQRVGSPDFGLTKVMDTTNRRTATEIDAIGAQSQQNGDLRARMFRLALGRLYVMAWSLYKQYDAEDLNYRFLSSAQSMDPQALHDAYSIEPKGGANEVNKQQIMARFMGYKQAFQQSPWIDQSVIDRAMLALNDPDLVATAFKDPNLKAQDEQTDEMKNIPTLLIGGPIPVEKGQNYALRIGVLMQYLQNARATGQQLPPTGIQQIVTRLQGLLAADAEVDNNGAKQLSKSVQEFLQSAGYIPAPGPQAGGVPAGSPPVAVGATNAAQQGVPVTA